MGFDRSYNSGLTRRYISISVSMIFPLACLIWLLCNLETQKDLTSTNLGIAFVCCSTVIPLAISGLCLLYLSSIESFVLLQLIFIVSTAIGIFTGLAGPANWIGFCLNASFIAWAFLLETPLGLATKLGLLLNGGAYIVKSLVAAKKEPQEWSLIIGTIAVAVFLQSFSWRFKNVLSSYEPETRMGSKILDDAKKLAYLVGREQRSRRILNEMIQEASRKVEEHRHAHSSTLAAYKSAVKTIEDSKMLNKPSNIAAASIPVTQEPALIQPVHHSLDGVASILSASELIMRHNSKT